MKNNSINTDKLKIFYKMEIENYLYLKKNNLSMDSTPNYLSALIALSKKGNVSDFLRTYSYYLGIKGTHLLKINDAMLIFSFLSRSKYFLKNIKYLSKLINGKKLDYDSSVSINSYILSSYDSPEIMKVRITLLSILVNENIHELCKENFEVLIKCVFRMNISANFVGATVDDLKSELGLFLYWAKSIAKSNVNQIANFNRLYGRFKLSNCKSIPWSSEAETFLNLLESLICEHYSLVCCNVRMVNQLIYFYKLNPQIFHKSNPELSEFENADFILEPFFKNFHIPEVFLKNYLDFADVNEPNIELRLLQHVIQGQSIRKFSGLPITMDKKSCHVLRDFKAPGKYDFWKYFVVCKLLSVHVELKYSEEVYERIKCLQDWDYWVSSFEILYKNGLPQREIVAVVDYLNYVVFSRRIKINLKKKSIKNLLKDIRKWHKELNLLKIKSIPLPKSQINSFEVVSENQTYLIKQLTNSRQLYLEGYELKHCVYTYVRKCLYYDCQIFSLRIVDKQFETPLITIEVNNKSIVQIRGRYNRYATESELRLINDWAKKENLHLKEAA